MLTKQRIAAYTLLEVLISISVAGIIMAGLFGFYRFQLRNHVTQQAVLDMQQNARFTLYMMARDIRMAGYDPTGRTGAFFLIANRNEIQFQADENEDGDFDDPGGGRDPGEQIRYALSDHQIVRETWNDGPQSMADNFDALDFVYLDENGAVLDDDGHGNVVSSMPEIRTVQVSFVARTGKNIPLFLNRQTDTRTYTNRQGRVILPSPNDSLLRLYLSTVIRVRNSSL